MVHCVRLFLAFSVLFSLSSAWWSRRRRSCSAVNCRVSSWTSWSTCTRTCGSGLTTRTRRKTVTESCGGGCAYHLKETKTCNSNCCPVNCLYSWSSWGPCLGCGISSHSRSPIITRYSSCNGRSCPNKETKSCNTNV